VNLRQKLAAQTHCQACDADLTGSDMAAAAKKFWPYCSAEHRDEYEAAWHEPKRKRPAR
jgi:hypothetical protein